MDADALKSEILALSKAALIDEVRFVDAGNLGAELLGGEGNLPAFSSRQPRALCLSNFLESETPADAGLASRLESADPDGYFFECDICQNACPHNQRHMKTPLDTPYGRMAAEVIGRARETMDLRRLCSMTREQYAREIQPLIIGFEFPYELFMRNVALLCK